MFRLILLFNIIFFWAHSFAQGDPDEKVVGFTCDRGGSATEIAWRLRNLLEEKRYEGIISGLYSDTAAHQFLAAFAVQRLLKDESIQISHSDSIALSGIMTSKEKIKICSGCTIHEVAQLRKLLNYKEGDRLNREDQWIPMWLDQAEEWVELSIKISASKQ